jgi:hypothetical protein
MHAWWAALAAFGFWQTASAKVDSDGNFLLEPLTLVDLGLQRRDAAPQVGLVNQTSLLWGETNASK